MSPRRVLASIAPVILLVTALAPLPATARNGVALGAVFDLDLPVAMEANLRMTDVEVSAAGGFLVTGWEPGSFDSTIVRLTPDGSVDRSFGNLGGVDWKDSAEVRDVEERGDATIVTAGERFQNGERDIVLHGLEADGSRDTTFGDNGVAFVDGYENDYGCGLTIQEDGSILLAYRSFEPSPPDEAIEHDLLTRLLPDGVPDPSFGDDGTIEDAGCDPLVQADGRVVVRDVNPATTDCTVLRFLPDGSPDPSFGTGAAVSVPGTGCPIALRAAGGFLVAAETGAPGEIAVHGLTADGAPDPSFGTDGAMAVDVGSHGAAAVDIVELPDGRIVVGGGVREPGTETDLLLIGVTSGGELDPTFGIDGVLALDRYGNESVDRLLVDGDRLLLQYASVRSAAPPCCVHVNTIAEVLPHSADLAYPLVTWRVPLSGADPYESGDLQRLRGSVTELASGVREPVTVALGRTLTGGACEWMRADGRFRLGACDAMEWLPAAGTFRFGLQLPRPLKPSMGTEIKGYWAYGSATDGAGNTTIIYGGAFLNPVRFEVSR